MRITELKERFKKSRWWYYGKKWIQMHTSAKRKDENSKWEKETEIVKQTVSNSCLCIRFDTMQRERSINIWYIYFFIVQRLRALMRLKIYNHWGNHITKARNERNIKNKIEICVPNSIYIDWCRNSMCYVSCCCCFSEMCSLHGKDKFAISKDSTHFS